MCLHPNFCKNDLLIEIQLSYRELELILTNAQVITMTKISMADGKRIPFNLS